MFELGHLNLMALDSGWTGTCHWVTGCIWLRNFWLQLRHRRVVFFLPVSIKSRGQQMRIHRLGVVMKLSTLGWARSRNFVLEKW